jgi:hypothetical protein
MHKKQFYRFLWLERNEYFIDNNFINKLQEICYDNKRYLYFRYLPLNKFKNFLISNSDMTLELNLSKFKKLLAEYNINPDVEIIKILCKYKKSYYPIKYLIEKYNIKPDVDCLINCNKSYKTAQFLGNLLSLVSEAN